MGDFYRFDLLPPTLMVVDLRLRRLTEGAKRMLDGALVIDDPLSDETGSIYSFEPE